MGYTTDFNGKFELDKPLSPEHAAYLKQFSGTRRMKRDNDKLYAMADPIREAVELDLGTEGEYFVGGGGSMGQAQDPSIINYNDAPSTQPGLWCQWVPNEAGTAIEWDEGEKFYDYVEWLKYLIENFIKPWGYKLNGEVNWHGEDDDDLGLIVVENNKVAVRNGRVVYE